MIRFLALCLSLAFSVIIARAQTIEWVLPADIPQPVREGLPEDVDNESVTYSIDQGIMRLQQAGYLLARVHAVDQDSLRVTLKVDPGSRYTWTELSAGNLPDVIRNRIGFRPGRYDLLPVSRGRLEQLFERILRESERSGYPYAIVRLDSIAINGSDVSAAINYESGIQVRYGSLLLTDSSLVKAEWMAAYLDIRHGEIYDQRQIDRIGTRVEALEFVDLSSSPLLIFNGGEVDILLDPEKIPSNRVDAVIGFLPNEEDGGGLRITGEAQLHLDNLFRSGKSFDFHWQRMRPETQFLELAYVHPNLLRSNLDALLDFRFLKEDTTFTTRDFNIRFDYRSGRHMFSVLSRFRSARLLEVEPNLESLPEAADFNLNDYGLAYTFSDRKLGWLGYRGFHTMSDFRIGNKNIRRNAALPAEVYEGIDENLLQWESNAAVSWGFLTF
ncbi:MAG: hypothetical protein P8X57_04440 [Cyclobacteriaceae bacterium]